MALLLAALCLIGGPAQAETVRGDLSARFEETPTMEYNGATYRRRGRVTTVLFMCVDHPEGGAAQTRIHYLLAVDDDARVIHKIFLNGNTLVTVDADGAERMRLCDVYASGDTPEEGCKRVVAAVNRLFSDIVIDHYLALDLRGIAAMFGCEIDAASMDDAALKACLREIFAEVEASHDNSHYTEMYSAMGDYLVTEMKSGVAMKICDKMGRYEMPETRALSGESGLDESGGAAFEADTDDVARLTAEIFYETVG